MSCAQIALPFSFGCSYHRYSPFLVELNEFVFNGNSKEDNQSDKLQSSQQEEIVV